MVDNLERISKRYRALSLGDVAKGYTSVEEATIYSEVADLISARYGDIISKDEIEKVLASKGRIYTMVVKNRVAFYEYRTGNIGIPHFLRLTPTLCHELVHKIGYLSKDDTFTNMNPQFKEAGTEIVAATAQDENYGRILIFNGVYGKFPQKTDVDFLSIALVNQINQVLGGKKLEKSILKGHDYFKEEIIKRWGEEQYVYLSENIKDIARIEAEYWNEFNNLSDEQKTIYEMDLSHRIADFQDTIIDIEFGSRVNNVKSKEEAEKFLNDLIEFGYNRVRFYREDSDGNRELFDPNFMEIFNDFKEYLELDYGSMDVEYDESNWREKYPKKEIIKDVSDEELDEVYLLSRDVKKDIKASKGLAAFINKMFRNRGTDSKPLLTRPIEKYKLDYDPLKVEEIKSSNQDKKRVQEELDK
jgi:hypothetical protein